MNDSVDNSKLFLILCVLIFVNNSAELRSKGIFVNEADIRCDVVSSNRTFAKPSADKDFLMTWNDAHSYCMSKNSFLMQGPLPCGHKFGNDSIWVAIKLINRYFQVCGPKPRLFFIPSLTTYEKINNNWWKNGHPSESYGYDCVGVDPKTGSYFTSKCDEKLAFVCESDDSTKLDQTNVNKVKVEITPKSIEPMPSKRVGSLLLKCVVTAEVDGKVEELNSDQHKVRYSWTKDGLFIESYKQTLLPKSVYLRSRSQQLYNGQGVYQCHVLVPGHNRWIESQNLTVKFTDVTTFIVTLSGEQLTKYNPVVNGFSTVGYQSFLDGTLTRTVNQYIVDIYRGNPKIDVKWALSAIWLDSSKRTNIRVLVYLKQNEKSVLRLLKDFRRKLNRKLLPRGYYKRQVVQNEPMSKARVTIRADVVQTDFCSQEYSYRFNVRWTRTRTVGSNISQPACLTDNMELYHRKCLVDYDNNGAYWEPISKCNRKSTLNRTYFRPPERILQCPDDYREFGVDRCQKFYSKPMTWQNANRRCNKDFTSLALSTKPNDKFQLSIPYPEGRWIPIKRVYGQYQVIHKDEPNLLISDEKIGREFDPGDCLYSTNNSQWMSTDCNRTKLSFSCSTNKMMTNYQTVEAGSDSWLFSMFFRKLYRIVVDDYVTWPEAESKCRAEGGSLMNMIEKKVSDSILFYFNDKNDVDKDFNSANLWFGLHRTENRSYKWIDGGLITYEMWDGRADFESPSNNYGFIRWTSKQRFASWGLGSDRDLKGYVCEISLEDPSSLVAFDKPEMEIVPKDVQDVIDERVYDNMGYKYPRFSCRISGIVAETVVIFKDGIPLGKQRYFGSMRRNRNFQRSFGVELDAAYYLQGYFWCRGQSMISQTNVVSQKVLFKTPGVVTFVCELTLTSFEGKIPDSFRPTYYSMKSSTRLEMKTKLLSFIDTSMLRVATLDILVDRLESLDDGTVRIKFSIYRLPIMMSKRKRRLAYGPKTLTPAELETLILQGLKSRAVDPDAFNDTTSSWLKSYGVLGSGVVVRRTDACSPVETQTSDGSRHMILTWPETPAGRSTRPMQLCTTIDGEPVIRRCLGNFTSGLYWSQVIGRCDGTPTYITKQLRALSLTPPTGNVSKLASSLNHLTSSAERFHTVDIGYVADIVGRISNEPEQLDVQTASNVIESVDRILNVDQEMMTSSQEKLNSSMVMLRTLDDVVDRVHVGDDDDDDEWSKVRLVGTNIAAEVWSLKSRNRTAEYMVIGIADLSKKLDGQDNNDINLKTILNSSVVDYGDVDAAITLPDHVIKESKRLGFVVYKTGKLFDPSSYEYLANQREESHLSSTNNRISENGRQLKRKTFELNTAVISASLTNKLGRSWKIKDLNPPVNLVFKPNQDLDATDPADLVCVYWDMTINDRTGGWSSSGCRMDRQKNGRVVCHCDHLTNFAVLVDLYGQTGDRIPAVHRKALDIITYIGCVISTFGLLLTILTFVCFKKWRKSLTNQIHVNLAVALLLSIVVFVVGSDKRLHRHRWSCLLVAVLLHYFLLTSFLWMLVEAVKHYLFFVTYMKSYVPNFIKKSMVIAWGAPLIVIVVTVSIDFQHYNGGKYYCWMDLEAFYFGFLLPMGLILFVNIILFARILYSLMFDRQRKKSKLRTNQPKNKDVRIRFYAAVGIFTLSGMTWVFAFFAVSEARLTFQYLFCIFNASQGFFIFFLMVFKERSARSFWESTLRHCCQCGQRDEFVVQYSSSTGNNARSSTKTTSTSNGDSRRVRGVKVLP